MRHWNLASGAKQNWNKLITGNLNQPYVLNVKTDLTIATSNAFAKRNVLEI